MKRVKKPVSQVTLSDQFVFQDKAYPIMMLRKHGVEPEIVHVEILQENPWKRLLFECRIWQVIEVEQDEESTS